MSEDFDDVEVDSARADAPAEPSAAESSAVRKTRIFTAPHVITFAALCLLVVVSSLLWDEWHKRFPQLEQGSYIGAIHGIWPDDKNGPTNLYVEKKLGSDELLFIVFRRGWGPSKVSTLTAGERQAESAMMMPVSLNGEDAKLKFIGHKTAEAHYQGAVTDLASGVRGAWELARLPESSRFLTDEGQRKELMLRLQLKAELDEAESQIASASAAVPEQKKEIEQLTGFITEGTKLRARGEEKYNAIKEELKDAQALLKTRQEEGKELERRFDLAHRVTGLGKLALLARESNEREGRWIDSMLKVSAGAAHPELEDAWERAEKITRLIQDIKQEREKIARLNDKLSE